MAWVGVNYSSTDYVWWLLVDCVGFPIHKRKTENVSRKKKQRKIDKYVLGKLPFLSVTFTPFPPSVASSSSEYVVTLLLDAGQREIPSGRRPRMRLQLLPGVEAHVVELERIGLHRQIGVDCRQLGLKPVERVLGGVELLLKRQQSRLQLLHFVRQPVLHLEGLGKQKEGMGVIVMLSQLLSLKSLARLFEFSFR